MFAGDISGLDTGNAESVHAFEEYFKVKVNPHMCDRGGIYTDDTIREGSTKGDYRRHLCYYVVSPAAATRRVAPAHHLAHTGL